MPDRKPHAHDGTAWPETYRLIRLRTENPALYRTTLQGALRGQLGSIPLAAGQLEIAESTLRRWLEKDPSICHGIELRGQFGRPRKPHVTHKKKVAP